MSMRSLRATCTAAGRAQVFLESAILHAGHPEAEGKSLLVVRVPENVA